MTRIVVVDVHGHDGKTSKLRLSEKYLQLDNLLPAMKARKIKPRDAPAELRHDV